MLVTIKCILALLFLCAGVLIGAGGITEERYGKGGSGYFIGTILCFAIILRLGGLI